MNEWMDDVYKWMKYMDGARVEISLLKVVVVAMASSSSSYTTPLFCCCCACHRVFSPAAFLLPDFGFEFSNFASTKANIPSGQEKKILHHQQLIFEGVLTRYGKIHSKCKFQIQIAKPHAR
jgi:hypothetical protein